MISQRTNRNILRVIATACIIFMGAWVLAEQPGSLVNRDDVLFLAHFNCSLVPDFSRGSGEPTTHLAEISKSGEGYPFINSSPSAKALNLRSSTSWIAWPAADHFDFNEGTVQFWVKPFSWRWKRPNSPYALLFRLRFDESRKTPPWENTEKAFYIAKRENHQEISLSQGKGSILGNIGSWKEQTWHQIAATWKGERLTLYLDGQKAGERKYHKPIAEPTEIVMGSPFWGHNATCMIDELRILKRALDRTEIWRDYLTQQVERHEFPGAITTNVTDAETFQLIVPEVKKVESNLENIEFRALYTTEAIKVDGELDEPAWDTAQEVTGFRLQGKASATPVEAQSFVKILYDEKNIYFGMRCFEPQMDKLEAKFNQRDQDVFADDCLEIVFDTRGTPETFYHFAANLIGGIYDSKASDRNWSSFGSSCLGVRGSGEWTLELAIPFTDLEIPRPTIGDTWGLRVCRERKPVDENTSVPYTATPFNVRQNLAQLVFDGGANTVLAFEANTKAEGIAWGMNRITIHLSNSGDTIVPARVVGSLFDKNNLLLDIFETRANIPARGETEVVLEVPVTTDTAARLSVVASDVNGSPVWGRALKPLFEPSNPSLTEIEAALPSFQMDANYISANRTPITQNVQKSVTRLEAEIVDFRAKVDAAVNTGVTVAPENWNLMRGVLAGFEAWRQQHEMLVWEVDPWANGTPNDLPPSDATSVELQFIQAGNERECRALAIHGLMVQGRYDIRLAVSHLKRVGEPKSYFSPNHIHVYRAPYVRDNSGRLITDPLLEYTGNIITLSPGRTEKVWVVLDSRGLKPGAYEATITVKPLDTSVGKRSEWKTIPIHATVWDFTLPETKDWPIDTFLFGPGLSAINEIEAVRLLHDYHINWVMSNRFQYDVGLTEDGKVGIGRPRNIPFNKFFRPELISSQDDFLNEAQRLGMKVMFAWNSSRNPDWFHQMVPHLKSLGFAYDEFAFQGMCDEFHAHHVEKFMPFHREIYAMDTNIQFMATLTSVPPPAGATFEQLEEPAKYIKIWIHHRPRVWPPQAVRTKENLTWFRARQRVVWSYTCARNMQNWPSLDYYRFSPWRGFLTGLDGICYWTLLQNNGDDGFDHGDGLYEGITYRGLNHAPVPTKRLEALREGLEDVAYMHILRTRLSDAKAKEPNRDFSAQEKLLMEIPLAIEKNQDTRELEAWREQTAQAILALPAPDPAEKH